MVHSDSLQREQRREVIQRELEWHDQEGHKRRPLDRILYAPPAFDDVVQAGLDFLDGQADDWVLDIGGGEGKQTLTLAENGYRVISLDLSQAQLAEARERLEQSHPGLKVFFVQANAEELPFKAGCLPAVYGKAVIHHLDMDIMARELHRVLPDRGRATFAEPLAYHPLIWLGRVLTPRLRTQDERPMARTELVAFARHFAFWQSQQVYLLAPLAYLLRVLPGGETLFRVSHRLLRGVDSWLVRLPGLRDLAWYGLVHVEKGSEEKRLHREHRGEDTEIHREKPD